MSGSLSVMILRSALQGHHGPLVLQSDFTGLNWVGSNTTLRGCQFTCKLTGEKMSLLSFANTEGVDQPAILSSLIRTFVVC